MMRNISGLSVALAAAVSVAGLSIQATPAAGQEYKPKVEVKSPLQRPLTGVDGKQVIIKHFTIPPGFVGERHFHPGPVFVYVLEGAITIETGGKTQTVSAGELYQEPLREVMQGRNQSASEGAKFVVFQVGDAGKPMMIKAE